MTESVIFAAARKLPADARPAYLDRECQGQPELRQSVEELLSELERDPGFIEQPVEITAFLEPPQGPEELGRLGPYRVLKLLGAGGMGVVFQAEELPLLRPVALKVMKPALAASPAARQRFLREARAAAAVNNDHVVVIYAVGDDRPTPFLAMELLSGESLADRLRREPRPPTAEVLRIGREIADGLAAAGARGLVHRDVKPANLWLEQPAGRVKLLDFGLARPVAGAALLTERGAIQGTIGYLSPEQGRGEEVGARSDLFSLGCVLYQMTTGRLPFPVKDLMSYLTALAVETPCHPRELNPDVPVGLADLILRLLARDPADRPASAAEVGQALRALAEGATPENVMADQGQSPARDRPPTTPTATFVPAPVPAAPRRTASWWRWPAAAAALATTATVVCWVASLPPPESQGGGDPPRAAAPSVRPSRTPNPRYRGELHVHVERAVEPGKPPRLLALDDPRTLPLRRGDKFRIEAKVEPAAYLYLVWVDPGQDVTPVYPWDPADEVDPWKTRPAAEEPVTRVNLPTAAGMRYTAPNAKPGVATMVVLARPTPLDVPDDIVRGWFEALPDLPLPPGGERGVVWFDDYVPVTEDPSRRGTFLIVPSGDPFAAWQGQLQQAVGGRAAFQTAVSFARTDQ